MIIYPQCFIDLLDSLKDINIKYTVNADKLKVLIDQKILCKEAKLRYSFYVEYPFMSIAKEIGIVSISTSEKSFSGFYKV